eukprot:scaffold2511_cov25-Cyclotella_meneghiniana.AAC.1
MMSASSSLSEESSIVSPKSSSCDYSFASDYSIRINAPILVASSQSYENDLDDAFGGNHGVCYSSTWEFHLLEQGNSDNLDAAVMQYSTYNKPLSNSITCTWENDQNQWYLEIIESKQIQNDDDNDSSILPRELTCIIGRIMVQYAATHISSLHHENYSALLHLTLPTLQGETFQEFQCSQLLTTTTSNNDGVVNNNYNDANIGIRQLFQPLNSQYANMELVDMVNDQGDVILGSLPRPYVHTWNILHRGVGVIVSRDVSILNDDEGGYGTNNNDNKPNVYVHQRTDTKRIFPSLFDMFVGGVSCRGECAELTAARELAEELGLRGALNYYQKKEVVSGVSNENSSSIKQNPLSSELFRCTIGTAYNRCVVSVFAYQCLTDVESIHWQKEEVQWGEFVPYDVVEVAAALSVDRLKASGTWPGNDDVGIDKAQMTEKIQMLKNEYTHNQAWDSWDFVPDGLLVWEAWLKWYNTLE